MLVATTHPDVHTGRCRRHFKSPPALSFLLLWLFSPYYYVFLLCVLKFHCMEEEEGGLSSTMYVRSFVLRNVFVARCFFVLVVVMGASEVRVCVWAGSRRVDSIAAPIKN